ncbi:hypothetical protein CFOL_v3_18787 [Cephalotus follicularis]|uniref:DUF8040 domain-containing protein n=1 Tax=Cephalotus follicularis TaxID=3775 RepID=A0A1Q3C5D8_CEPFO|nr:hypothetical protein CFOL_v3_18787 [Cephalotus follicularis]
MNSHQTGHKWIFEVMQGNETRCFNMFKMEKHVFIKLINKLQSCYGLKVSRRMSALEMVGIFVNIVSDCIGAIDEVHVPACVSPADSIPFIGRKGIPTQNVMAACGFDMQFTFCLAGWEGTTHDTKNFYTALRNPELNFPHPPDGNQKIEFFFLFNWFLFVFLNSICIICCR